MSTSSTRFSRARLMTTPPGTGSAPPERPVPWPRATNGTPLARADPHDRLHLGRRRRQHDERRRLAQVRQRVALVGQQLHRLAQHARSAPQIATQFVEEPFGHLAVSHPPDGTLSDRASATGLRHRRPRRGPARRGASPSSSRCSGRRRPTRTARSWRPCARPSTARRCGRWSSRASGRHLGLRHHPRAAAARDAARHLRGDAALRRADVTILIATGTHRINTDGRARADARPRHPGPLPRHQPRQPRRRARSSASAARPPAWTCS